MLSPPQQQEAQHRIDAFSRSVAAEMAPIIGMMANPNPNPNPKSNQVTKLVVGAALPELKKYMETKYTRA